MAIERPTFHEAWYRVASLKPRLLASVNVFRQHFRGQPWFVLENSANNEYARISKEAYAFVGLLDGRRTVSQVWRHCNDTMGDDAPTQGEVIGILGQLYQANMLYVDLPPDSESLFKRQQKRQRREVQGQIMNIMYVRVPLIDPDRFLDILVKFAGWLYGWVGLICWLALIAVGVNTVIGQWRELAAASSEILNPDNMLWLYLAFVLTKIIHEFGHALACKRFGRLNRAAGHVHAMGVMFLIFFPLPYVDASSAWAFRNKWHRMVVGMGGVLSELALAAIAAIVWSRTSSGSLHLIAYNVMFVASVSTILFNGNPLLRFDAYYVLSDLLEIPNLGNRSKQYVYYWVKRYLWGLKKVVNPAFSWGERFWFALYGTTSSVFRVYICVRILLFLNDRLPEQLFLLVPLFVGLALVTWAFMPLGKLLKYLASSPELNQRRWWANLTAGMVVVALVGGLGFINAPEYWRVEGVIEPNDMAMVFASADGFVLDVLATDAQVKPDVEVLVRCGYQDLVIEKRELLAEQKRLEIQQRVAFLEEPAAAQIIAEQIEAGQEKLARIEFELKALTVTSPLAGTWISPEIDKLRGTFVRRGQALGQVSTLDHLMIRATASQNMAGFLLEQDYQKLPVQIRGKRCPDLHLRACIVDVAPAGLAELPSEALGYDAGGQSPTRRDEEGRMQAAERLFEIQIELLEQQGTPLFSGQRVIARIRMGERPLIMQWYHRARQLFQRRYFI